MATVTCAEEKASAAAPAAVEKKDESVDKTADKKQEKRGIFGEGYGQSYGYGGGHSYGGGHGYGGHGLSSLGGLGLDDHSGLSYGGHGLGDLHGHGAYGGLDDHHHHHHVEKTLTVVKNVAVPYPVEKHIHVPVEKVLKLADIN